MKIFTHLSVCLMLFANLANADVSSVEVTVTNNAPSGGVYLTPVWFGFHDGSFDSYDGGTASSVELERLAEDGNFGPLADTFGAGGTLVGSGSQNGAERVQGALGGGPLAPGATASQIVTLSDSGANNYFSYASMILPSSDYYIANGNPTAWDISDVINNGGSISFNVFQVNDAGTEINDFGTSAGNGLLNTLALPAGQSGPNQGADEFGVNLDVTDPFAGFLNSPGNADTDPAFALLNFNDRSIYANGVATITISAVQVPEPNSIAILSLVGAWMLRRRRA